MLKNWSQLGEMYSQYLFKKKDFYKTTLKPLSSERKQTQWLTQKSGRSNEDRERERERSWWQEEDVQLYREMTLPASRKRKNWSIELFYWFPSFTVDVSVCVCVCLPACIHGPLSSSGCSQQHDRQQDGAAGGVQQEAVRRAQQLQQLHAEQLHVVQQPGPVHRHQRLRRLLPLRPVHGLDHQARQV